MSYPTNEVPELNEKEYTLLLATNKTTWSTGLDSAEIQNIIESLKSKRIAVRLDPMAGAQYIRVDARDLATKNAATVAYHKAFLRWFKLV